MEKNPSSRKRRRPSPQQLLQGIFTRSRFELFIHRTRSGRGRADSDHRRKSSVDVEPPSDGIPNGGPRPGSSSFVSIKDLRTRRVFSPALVDEECSPEKKPKIQIDPDDDGRPELGFDEKTLNDERKIDDGVGVLGEELMQAMSSERDCKSSGSGDAKGEVGFGGEACYDERVIDDGVEAISCGVDGLDCKSSEPSDARREMEFDEAASYNGQKLNNLIEAISGGLDVPDEITRTMPPDSDDLGGSKLSNVHREVGSDGAVFSDNEKIGSGIETNSSGVDSSGEEWIQTTPQDGDILQKSDVQEGGNGRSIDIIGVDSAVENLSSTRISGANSSFNEEFVQLKKDATDSTVKNRPGLVPCSRLKLFQAPNSLSYRRLLPFLMDLAKDNASSLEIRSCKSLYSAKFKMMVGEKPHPPVLDSRSHISNLASGKGDISCGQNQVDDFAATPITERPVENKLDCLSTSFPEVLKESSPDGLSSALVENQRGKCPDALETFMEGELKEKSFNTLGISVTGKSEEMSSGTHLLDGFETPPAYKSVKMCHDVSSSDPFIAECKMKESLGDCLTETPTQNAPRSSIALHDPAILQPDLCTGTAVTQLDQVMPETYRKLDLGLDSVGSMTKIELSLPTSPICKEDLSMECATNMQDPFKIPLVDIEESTKPASAISTEARPPDSLNSQRSSQSESSLHLETPVPPTKGILKTHPRECRGLCTCPDCASFRLYAEKSNEFSKRQMQDAEGVAVGLMKELSSLRSLMEKMIKSGADCISDQSIVQVNQIKGFCRRATRAEELARNRLRQMTRDLNTHSRITTLQRSNVRFADYLEEKLILELEKEDDG